MRVAMLLTALISVPGVVLAHDFADRYDRGADHACTVDGTDSELRVGAYDVRTEDVSVQLTDETYHLQLHTVVDGDGANVSPKVYIESNSLNGLQRDFVCRDKADPRGYDSEGRGMNCASRDRDLTVCTDHADEQLT